MSATNGAGFDRDRLAAWYAKRHYEIDPGVVEIHYLPRNAGEREIRLLEVNKLIPEVADEHLEPVDFGVDIGQADGHTLLVLDVTPTQWRAIQTNALKLPETWTTEAGRLLPR